MSDIQYIATYGTLRDDNDSGASWTQSFIQGINHAVTGKVIGYRLIENPVIQYPFAVYTGNSNDSIVVRLLSWPTKEQLQEKVYEADCIEGDEYERKIVNAVVGNETKLAYIYISAAKEFDESWKPIASGDWLQRTFR